MGRLEEIVARAAHDLREGCGVVPDMALLSRVTAGCGPSVFDPAMALIDIHDARAIERLRRNFLIRKLGLTEGPDLREAIAAAVALWSGPPDGMPRVVLCYLLVLQFGTAARL